MRKKQRYGGLSPRHVRLIRDYLNVYNSPEAWTVLSIWMWLILNSEPTAIEKAKAAGFKKNFSAPESPSDYRWIAHAVGGCGGDPRSTHLGH
jgi:hypothetical protein